MIEIINNCIQFLAWAVCFIISGTFTVRRRSRGWAMLSFGYLCIALGTLYWLLYLIILGETPHVFYISETGWNAAYLFLCLLLMRLSRSGSTSAGMAWIAPLFTIGSCLFFFQWGDYLLNVLEAVLMGWLGYLSLRGVLSGGRHRPLYIACFAFFCFEYALWYSSCFFPSDTLASPYPWLDLMLTASGVMILPAYKKAVNA